MAEDDELDLGDGDSSASSPPKKSGFGALLPTLLKWIAIAVGAVIFIVTVVVITFNIMNRNASPQAAMPVSPEYAGKQEVLSWYTSIGQIKTMTSDQIPASVVVEVVLGYKLDDKTAPAEISEQLYVIKDFLRRYFSSKTAEDLKPQNEERIKLEIRNAINDDILSKSKIRDVRFLTYDVIEQ